MAKKDKIDNMDDFDDWGDFDDFNFDDEFPSENDRSPAAKVKKGLLAGVKATGKGVVNSLKARLGKEFPKTDDILKEGQSAVSDAKYLADKFMSDIQPSINNTKRAMSAMSHKLKPILSEDKLEKLQKMLETEEEYRPESEESRRNRTIESDITNVLKLDMEDRQDKYVEGKKEKLIEGALNEKRHTDLTNALQGIKLATTSVDTFNKTVNMGYYKKMLEIQYQHLFTAKDMLKISAATSKMLEAKLDQIRHNTSLPDIQKQFNSELIANMNKQRLIGGAQEGIANFLGNAVKKLDSKLNVSKSMINAFGNMMGIADGMGDMGGGSKSETFGELAGGAIANVISGRASNYLFGRSNYDNPWFLPDKVADKVYGKENEKGKLTAIKKRTEAVSNNAKYKLALELAHQKDITDPYSMTGSILDFVAPNLHRGAGTITNTVQDPMAPAVYDQSARLSLVEIIPGYLSKILQQATIIASGDPNTEQQVFDINKRKFSSVSDLRRSVTDMAFGSTTTRARNMDNAMGVLRGGMIRNSGNTAEFDSANDSLRTVVGNIIVGKYPIDKKIIKKYIDGTMLSIQEQRYIDNIFKDTDDPFAVAEILYKSVSGSSTADADFINDAFTSSTMSTVESNQHLKTLQKYIDSGVASHLGGLTDLTSGGYKVNDKAMVNLLTAKDRSKTEHYSLPSQRNLISDIEEYEKDYKDANLDEYKFIADRLDKGLFSVITDFISEKSDNVVGDKIRKMTKKDPVTIEKERKEKEKRLREKQEQDRLLRESSSGDYDFFDTLETHKYTPQKPVNQKIVSRDRYTTNSQNIKTINANVDTSGIESWLEKIATFTESGLHTNVLIGELVTSIDSKMDLLSLATVSPGAVTPEDVEGAVKDKESKFSKNLSKMIGIGKNKVLPATLGMISSLRNFSKDTLMPGIGKVLGRAATFGKDFLNNSFTKAGNIFTTVAGKTSEAFKDKRDMVFHDIYLKGSEIALVTSDVLKRCTFEDGTPVTNIWKINRPVIDPLTGQVVISKEQIESGLVLPDGTALAKKVADSAKELGSKAYELGKEGTKKAGGLLGNAASKLGGMLKGGDKVIFDAMGGLFSGVRNLVGGGGGGGMFGGGSTGTKLDKIILSLQYGFKLTEEQIAEINSLGGSTKGTASKAKDIAKKSLGGLVSGVGSLFGKTKGLTMDVANPLEIYQQKELQEDKDLREKKENKQEDANNVSLTKMTKYLKNIDENAGDSGGFLQMLLMLAGGAFGKITSMLGGLLKVFGLGKLADNLLGGPDIGLPDFDRNKPRTPRTAPKKGIWGSIKSFGKSALDVGKKFFTGRAGKVAAAGGALALGSQMLPDMPSSVTRTAASSADDLIVKTAAGSVDNIAAKAGTKAATQAATKGLTKSVIKKIPLLGAIAGLGFGISRALDGDFTGALMEVTSGVASTFPGAGTAASIGIDVALAARDYNNATSNNGDTPSGGNEGAGGNSTASTTSNLSPEQIKKLKEQAKLKVTQMLEDGTQELASNRSIHMTYMIEGAEIKDRELRKEMYSIAYARKRIELMRNNPSINRVLIKEMTTHLDGIEKTHHEKVKKVMGIFGNYAAANFKSSNDDNSYKRDAVKGTSAMEGELSDADMFAGAGVGIADMIEGNTDTSAGSGGGGGAKMDLSAYKYGSSFSDRNFNKNGGATNRYTSGNSSYGNSSSGGGGGGGYDGALNISDEEIAKIKPSLSPDSRLGSLFAKFESGRAGSAAIGWDSTGGTSYGKYQIASKVGTFKEFIAYLNKAGGEGPKIAKMFEGLKWDTGSRKGAAPELWKKLAASNAIQAFEHGFIKKTHYDAALKKLNAPVAELVNNTRVLQEVLWSTAVQHGAGGAGSIFNACFKEGITPKDFIIAIYKKRGTKFGSSTASVRKSVQDRFVQESQIAIANLNSNEAPLDTSGNGSVTTEGDTSSTSTEGDTGAGTGGSDGTSSDGSNAPADTGGASSSSSASVTSTESASSNVAASTASVSSSTSTSSSSSASTAPPMAASHSVTSPGASPVSNTPPPSSGVTSSESPIKSIDYSASLSSIYTVLQDIANSVKYLEKLDLKGSNKSSSSTSYSARESSVRVSQYR